jgi:hypothetical protein
VPPDARTSVTSSRRNASLTYLAPQPLKQREHAHGGRYGSLFDEQTGVSWTEHEYDYALANGIPVVAFIRKDAFITGDKMDTGDSAERLKKFKTKVRKHLVEEWGSIDDLRSRVAAAIPKQIQHDEDEQSPRPGWYRGGQVPPAAAEEIARLKLEVERLTALAAASANAEQGGYHFALHHEPGTGRQILEVRPTTGTWSPFLMAIPVAEKDAVTPEMWPGAVGHPRAGGGLIAPTNGVEGNWAFWTAHNAATTTMSYFIFCKTLPSKLLFGVQGKDAPQYTIENPGTPNQKPKLLPEVSPRPPFRT